MAHYAPQEAFEILKDRVSKTIKSYFPIEGQKNTLVANKVWVDDHIDLDDIRSQKEAKLTGRTWSVPVRAELELRDKATGKVKDRQVVNVAQLPKITRRYSYIVNGNEWQVNNLFKLKSGIYTRVKANGELVGDWNLAKGAGFEMNLDPVSKKISIRHRDQGSQIALYPILKTLGVDDDAIERQWGKEILSANKSANEEATLKTFYKSLKGELPQNADEAKKYLIDELGKTVLRADSTKLTMGKGFTQVNGESLLAGSHKMLQVSRQEAIPDDRDSLQFKDLYSAEDLIDERLQNWKTKKDLNRKITNVLDKHDRIRTVLSPDIFGRPIKNFFVNNPSGLSERPEQMNPISFLSGNRRTTLMAPGAGGITSAQQVSIEAQSINPSHMGFLDPIQTPEGARIGITLQLASAVRKVGHDLKVPVYNVKTKKREMIGPGEALTSNLAFPDQYTWKDRHPVPSAKLIKISDKEGTITMVHPHEVDYILPSTKGMFDLPANMIPFLQSDQGNRTMVAAKQLEQAVPLVHREEPLVQVRSDTTKTFEHAVGEFSSHVSNVDGKVEKISREALIIKDKKGNRHEVQLYEDFPLNDAKSILNSTPIVAVGDSVKAGQVVADTNFTRGGVLAIGTNLKIAYMPFRGLNFEDGIVISESAAAKLTSEHMLREKVRSDPNTILNKKKFVAQTAGQLTKDQAAKLDDDAVIKPGTQVFKDDVLIGVLKEESITPEQQRLSLISKKLISPVRAREIRWTKDNPGTVARVVKHGKDVTVYVKTTSAAEVGDKIVGRHGNKGILTCHDSLTEILTDQGWKTFRELDRTERVCTLNPDTRNIEYQKPTGYIEQAHEGKMYSYEGRRLNLCTTPEHNHFVRNRRGLFHLESAKDCFGIPRIHLRTGEWEGTEINTIEVPGRPDGPHLHKKFSVPKVYDADLFLEFFGLWITEGCLGNVGQINIAQTRSIHPETYERIVEVVQLLGYHACEGETTVSISDPRLHHWLLQFGKAKDKWIPREFLSASKRQLKILADALFQGDGGVYYREKDNHTRYELFTSSKRLADDYQELAFKLGFSANIKPQEKEDGTEYVVRWSLKDEVWTNNDKRYDNEQWADYVGQVYCVEVPNHVVYIRRNGIPVWSGNCILPDHEMPKDKEGKHVEVLLNPAGVPSRINLGQVLETAAAKIAEKTGKPYIVNNFDPDIKDYTRHLQAQLKAAGVSETEELFDPQTNRSYGQVLTGPQYILKLHHMAEKGLQARSRDAYDSNMQPRKGGPHSGQTMDALGLYAMLAHNARENIREMQSYKSDFNDDFWAMLQMGDSVPTPKIPFVFKKFEGYLKGMGIDLKKEGNDLILQPLTDKRVLEMSNGELQDPARALRAKDAKPEAGGVFDPKLTGTLWPGGQMGHKWTHITLPERIPNSVFENPISSLLGITHGVYQNIILGKQNLGEHTGPGAIVKALKGIDVASTKKALEKKIPSLRTTKLDKAYKQLKYLRALERAGMSPTEAYTTKHLPVLPPTMRPVTILPNGDINYDDINRLYNHIGTVNHKIKEFDPAMPPEEKLPLQSALYDAVKALHLTGTVYQGRHRNSIVEMIAGRKGQQPKEAFFQSKMIGKRQDLSLRGVIIPEPSMSLDEVGLPRKAAAELFKPFVVQRLVSQGHAPAEAQKMVKENHPAATSALEAVVYERPILLKRDPVLHKFGVQAFRSHLTEGKAVQIHPLATMSYNADFDGDKMSAYVPVSPKAVKEAFKMMPSHNLFNPTTGYLMFKPTHESALGLFKLTEIGRHTSKRFATTSDAAHAARKGEIGINDLVHIDEVEKGLEGLEKIGSVGKTTLGRLMAYRALPKEHQDPRLLVDPDFVLDKKKLDQVLSSVAKNSPGDFGKVSDKLKDLGNDFATGISISLKDFESDYSARDPILHRANDQELRIRAAIKDPVKRDEKIVQLYIDAGQKIDKLTRARAEVSGNRMYDWVRSGARGNWDQFKQMIVAPILVADSYGNPVPVPIGKSYSEGLDIGSYWAAMHGARMGTIGKVQGTQAPGKMMKQLAQVTMNQMILDEDCGVKKGVTMPLDDRDLLDRFTASDISLGLKGLEKGIIPAGSLVTPDLLSRLKNNKVKDVHVRSPLKCQHPSGMCSKCYGISENGQLHPQGTNIGIIAAHSLGEPAVQLSMDAFHSGGVVGAKGTTAESMFRRLEQLLNMPKKLAGSATLSTTEGEVEKIESNPAGGWDVVVGGDRHYVPANRELTVKRGSSVKPGDALCSGTKNPLELLKTTKNIGVVQRYLTDEIWNVYHGKSPVRKRNIETFVRAATNLAVVRDSGDHPTLLPGDRTAISNISTFNNQIAGTKKKPVVYEHVLQGINMLPLEMQTDWMARLQSRELKSTILDAAAEGWRSMLHGTHPVPGLAYAASFGSPPKGTDPWLY